MQMHERSKLIHETGYAAVATIAVVSASAFGQLATFPNLAAWYADLTKPAFNPPSWVFAPVSTLLYPLMVLAAWRILRLPRSTGGRSMALISFFLQLGLNAAWSWMFFAAHSPGLGLVNIVPQLVVIVVTIGLFHRLARIAAWCLVPLAAWVAFASFLNMSIWWLNG